MTALVCPDLIAGAAWATAQQAENSSCPHSSIIRHRTQCDRPRVVL